MAAVDTNILSAFIAVGGAVAIAVAGGAWKLARSMGSIEQLVRDINRSQQQITTTLANHGDRIIVLEARTGITPTVTSTPH
jgi:hypothetical protein